MDCKFEQLFSNLEFLLKFYNFQSNDDYLLIFSALLSFV
ncbi:hypothetical protein A1Q_1084 [Vibrio campbellii HY01]|nr:hypothetical protein A1Q_1084 [Vibrio campbellii HY01]